MKVIFEVQSSKVTNKLLGAQSVILVEPGHRLEGGGSPRVKLTNSITRRSISVGGVSHGDVRSKSVGVGEVSWLSISAPLPESLGAPGHEGGGGSGVGSNSGQTVSVAVGVAVGSVVVGGVQVAWVSLSISLGLSLMETVDRLVAGSRERPGVAGGEVRSVEVGVGVGSIEVGWVSLSISLSLSLAIVRTAAIAGGADPWGAHSGPVGVGVVQSRVGSIEVAWISLSLAGGDGDNGSSNQKFVHLDDDDTTHCGV